MNQSAVSDEHRTGNLLFTEQYWVLTNQFSSFASPPAALNINQTTPILAKFKSPLIAETHLPIPAQISNVKNSISRDDLRKVFNDHPLLMRLDILAVDSKYVTLDDIHWSHKESALHATTMTVDLAGSFQEYWGGRSKNLQKNIKRYINRLNKDFDTVETDVQTSPDQLKQAIEQYGDIESKGWKSAAGTAIHKDNRQGKYYEELLTGFATTGNACAYELIVDGKVIASRLCLVSEDCLIILKTTYDEAFSEYAPSRVLLYNILEQEFSSQRTRRIEFYTNATRDQLAWSTSQRDIKHLSLYRNALCQTAIHSAKSLTRALKNITDNTETKAPPLDGPIVSRDSVDNFTNEEIQLVDETAGAYPFTSRAYMHAYEAHVLHQHDNITPCYVFVYLQQSPIAFLPLECNASQPHKAKLLGNYYFFKNGLFIKPSQKTLSAQIYAAASSFLRDKFSIIDCSPIHPSDSDTLDFLASLRASHHWQYVTYRFSENWHTSVPCKDQYLDNLPSKLKNTIKRAKKKHSAAFSISINRLSDTLPEAMSQYWNIYRKSWKQDEPYKDFINEIVSANSRSGNCLVAVGYADDVPIAAQIWVLNANTAYIYKLAYDPEYKKLSPGTLLTEHLIDFVTTQCGVTHIDFLNGTDRFKKDWMDLCDAVSGYKLMNKRSTLGILAIVYEKMLSTLKTSRTFIRSFYHAKRR